MMEVESGSMDTLDVVSCMTRDEFLSKLKAVEHRELLLFGFIPWGIVIYVWLGLIGYSIFLAVLLFQFLAGRIPVLCELAFCIVVVVSVPLALRRTQRRAMAAFSCPSCHKWLGGDSGVKVLESGRCGHCGAGIIDA
jgi:hypothetical protein